jgi:hypothetical protein
VPFWTTHSSSTDQLTHDACADRFAHNNRANALAHNNFTNGFTHYPTYVSADGLCSTAAGRPLQQRQRLLQWKLLASQQPPTHVGVSPCKLPAVGTRLGFVCCIGVLQRTVPQQQIVCVIVHAAGVDARAQSECVGG